MILTGSVNDREIERGRPNASTHEATGCVIHSHQPAEWVMVRMNSETGTLNVWVEREDGQNHCDTFQIGILVSSFDIRDKSRPVTDGCLFG